MAWDNIKLPAAGGEILKLESGRPYRLRIVGEPYVYQSEFEGKLSNRYAMAVWNQNEKAPQILMLPGGAFREILGYANNEEDWGNPEDYDFIITKTGSGLETRYAIQPSPKKTPLLSDEKAAVTAIDLADVLSRLPSVTRAYRASELGDNPFPVTIQTERRAGGEVPAKSLQETYNTMRAEKTAEKAAAKAVPNEPDEPDEVYPIDDEPAEPINLNDIPF